MNYPEKTNQFLILKNVKLNKKKKFKKETEIEELYLKFDIEKSKWIEILDFLNKNKLLKEQEKLSL